MAIWAKFRMASLVCTLSNKITYFGEHNHKKIFLLDAQRLNRLVIAQDLTYEQ